MRATSDKRSATSDKRSATSDKRSATSDKRSATSGNKISFQPKDPEYIYNDDLIDYFKELIDIYDNIIGDLHRGLAYSKAISTLKKIDHPLLSGEEAATYKNIGESMKEDIQEFINGKKPRLDKLKKDIGVIKYNTIKLFTTIHGIGIVTANKLYDEGYTTIEELKNYNKFTAAQELGIKYYEEYTKRIPRKTVKRYEEVIKISLEGMYDIVEIVGSYRRGAASSGDIDVLIVVNKLSLQEMNRAFNKLSEDGIIMKEYFAKGPTKFMGLTNRGHHRIDIRMYTEKVYPTALLHLTGSDDFNKKMRQRAITLGMRLSEYSLTYFDGEMPYVNSEESIFAGLFVKYIPPEGRNEGVKLEYTEYPNGLED